MGDRYVICSVCGFEDQETYYASTCSFLDWKCSICNYKVDMEKLTGSTYEERLKYRFDYGLIDE